MSEETPHVQATLLVIRGKRLWQVTCPYCKKTHVHGAVPGHRAPHCYAIGNSGYILDPPLVSP